MKRILPWLLTLALLLSLVPNVNKAQAATKEYAITIANTTLYKGKGTKKIKTLPKGTIIFKLGTSGAYTKVSYSKYTGYIKTKYVKLAKEYTTGTLMNFIMSTGSIKYDAATTQAAALNNNNAKTQIEKATVQQDPSKLLVTKGNGQRIYNNGRDTYVEVGSPKASPTTWVKATGTSLEGRTVLLDGELTPPGFPFYDPYTSNSNYKLTATKSGVSVTITIPAAKLKVICLEHGDALLDTKMAADNKAVQEKLSFGLITQAQANQAKAEITTEYQTNVERLHKKLQFKKDGVVTLDFTKNGALTKLTEKIVTYYNGTSKGNITSSYTMVVKATGKAAAITAPKLGKIMSLKDYWLSQE